MPIVNPTAEWHCERFGYRLPFLTYIGSGPRTDRLLALEGHRNEVINKLTQEMMKFANHRDEWKEALPEVLGAILDSYDSHAADAAAIAYLRKRGYQITDKTEGY